MAKNKEDKISIRRLISNTAFMIKYAAKYDRPLIIKIFLMNLILKAAMSLNGTFILKMIIDGLTGKATFGDIAIILLISLALVVCIEWINQILEEWTKAKIIKLDGKIQRDLVEKNSKMDLIYYDNPDYYDTYVFVANNADHMIEGAVVISSKIFGGIVALLVAASLIMTINPFLAVFPIVGFIVNLITRFKMEEIEYTWWLEFKKHLRKADYSKRVFYQPEYAKECKLTNVKEPLRLQFDEALDAASAAGRKYTPALTWISLLNWITVFTVLSFFAVPAYLGYLALVLHKIALGEVASANNAANYVRGNLNEINYCLVDFQIIGQYAEKFRKLLDYEPVIEVADGLTPDKEAGSLVLSNVSFRYPNTEKDTLKDISIEIKPGEKIAIVGENGAGKTTFVKLLMRLYDVTDGSIKYNGHDIREYKTSEYRKKISAVFQDYNIYAATLAENVLLRTYQKEDEKDVIEALKKADFSKKLAKLPDGI
ncbi:MAG: ABC transporter ATP-binding protein [Lachnospiraceae bacterium]|nr:ABC transporter ATP-binding protein [Lachnospiraceae bacterium]